MHFRKMTAGVLAGALVMASHGTLAASWTLEQVARQALASHPDIVGKEYSLDAAEANVQGAKWQRFPTLGVEAGKANDGSPRFTDISVTQPIWTGGRITGGIASAEASKDAASAGVDEARQDVLLRVMTAYVEAMRQQARENVAEREVAQHQQLLDMINRRVAAQASARVDAQLAESRLYQANDDLSTAQQALATALVQLSQLTGKPVDSVSDYDIKSLPMPGSLDNALDRATGASPTLLRLNFERDAALADVKVKKAAVMPQVSVRFDQFYGQDPIVNNTQRGSRVMLLIEAQPGAGLSAVSAVKAAQAAAAAAEQASASAKRDLSLNVAADWNDLNGSRVRFANTRLSSESSKAVYESYVRQYSAGKKSWLDVMNTVRESIQADMNVIDARAQMTAAALRLEVRTGDLSFIGNGDSN
ncbi:TolC family protein [Paraburkholderia silviterrae]|uniref:Adhesin transport system outer membrane protein n=1 Tax=Paraburkholderia silviterrae TaxID=2528715 RepID=A0A4R5M2A2_9BURK|nr:TolC family protein [Paraburkholderia silviterrae]TDG19272.1 hypothetical protein EYW47_31555 [Paraburkholderia silviterrae]